MWSWLSQQYNDIKGNAKWAAIAAFWWVAIHYGKEMLHLIPHISTWLVDALLLCFSLIVFVWLATRHQQASIQAQGGALMNAAKITPHVVELHVKRVEEFYHTYDNALLHETEANMKAISDVKPQGEREQFFLRFIATGILSYVFDTIWYTIYASQIKALQTLNAKPLKREEVRPFYSDAVASSPSTYKNYSFDQWIGFLREQGLITEQVDMVGITQRGREFLKYLIHQGRPMHTKRL